MAFKGIVPGTRLAHRRIHISPIDARHMIEVWEDAAGTRYFIPHYSKTGRSWSHYAGEFNGMHITDSYAAAANYIKRNLRRD